MTHYVSHLEGAIDGTRLPFGPVYNLHAGRPILVRYRLDRVRAAVTPADIARRPPTLWRYRELLPLPLEVEPVTLGEGLSPLLPCPRLGADLGLTNLLVKDESQLPTGSFKSRGMTTAVSMAKWLGVTRLALPTAGNAGGAAAAYAARAGIPCVVYMPADTPAVNRAEPPLYGAEAHRIAGLIDDCGKLVKAGADRGDWFDLSTLKEPYRVEGKKTMGIELAEQLGWRLPDVILYPTGGGTGLIGMWKAFAELAELGWIPAGKLPRLYACQSDGCAPIATAFAAGERHAQRFPNAATVASGLRVPAAVGDFLMLDAIRASGGQALTAPEGTIRDWMVRASALEGVGVCPEAAVCFEVLAGLVRRGEVRAGETVVVFNTGAAHKYVEAMPAGDTV